MYPIILAHGIARFDILRELLNENAILPDGSLNRELQYFKNIAGYLGEHGFPAVHSPNVNFAGSLDLRAARLKSHVEDVLAATGEEKVHIIAHSMGGLDARKMIFELGMAEKVFSLTTIGTPHLGTILADRVLGHGGSILIRQIRDAVGLDLDGFADLTVDACDKFNRLAEAAEAENKVFYQTYSSFERIEDIFLPLVPSWIVISLLEGRNDGLVPVRSQQWKGTLTGTGGKTKQIPQHEFPLPADHLNQVGWWDWEESVNPFFNGSFQTQKEVYEGKIKDIYLGIAEDLRNRQGE